MTTTVRDAPANSPQKEEARSGGEWSKTKEQSYYELRSLLS